MDNFELIFIIVNYGMGSKVLKIAVQNGVPGGTVFLGNGTVKNRVLEFLGLADIKKEIIIIAAEKQIAKSTLENLDNELKFSKPNHGIAFTTPLPVFLKLHKVMGDESGCKNNFDEGKTISGGADNIMYKLIMVITERGKAELIMEAATGAGARGGTVIKARGAGHYDAVKVFNMDIEPEKEIVIILSENDGAEKIINSVRDRLEAEKVENGVIFCQDVNGVYGIS